MIPVSSLIRCAMVYANITPCYFYDRGGLDGERGGWNWEKLREENSEIIAGISRFNLAGNGK